MRSCSNLSKKSGSADGAGPRGGGPSHLGPPRGSLAFTPRAGLLRPARSRTRQTPWSVFQDGPLGAAVPASLTALGEGGRRGASVRGRAPGSRPPPAPRPPGRPPPAPRGGRGSSSSSAPRAAAGGAARGGARGEPPAPPGPAPPPCRPRSRRWPSRRDGRGDGERGAGPAGGACDGAPPARPRPPPDRRRASRRARGRRAPSASLPAISSAFGSLLRVLFIFPSRYLFAIGLSPVFSLGWGLPPAWGCIPERPDSGGRRRPAGRTRPPGPRLRLPHGALTLRGTPSQGISGGWCLGGTPATPAREATIRGALRRPDSGLGLLPLRSPLLGESWLVSFPPLNDMLKSGG